MNDYYRDRIAQAEIARENLRAARVGGLYEALHVVLDEEGEILSEDDAATLSRAYDVVGKLHQIW